MTVKMEKFMKKHCFDQQQIKYILREQGKTCIHLTDGRVIATYLTIRELMDSLPEGDFLRVSRTCLLAVGQIGEIRGRVYQMKDGRQFLGRENRLDHPISFQEILPAVSDSVSPMADLIRSFSLLDQMPMAFCVIELMFDQEGLGSDFIFRYCNQMMEEIENKRVEELLNQSFYKIFHNADQKWLAIYGDVGLNGTVKTIRGYSPEVEKQLILRCFQPAKEFCACLIEEEIPA